MRLFIYVKLLQKLLDMNNLDSVGMLYFLILFCKWSSDLVDVWLKCASDKFNVHQINYKLYFQGKSCSYWFLLEVLLSFRKKGNKVFFYAL